MLRSAAAWSLDVPPFDDLDRLLWHAGYHRRVDDDGVGGQSEDGLGHGFLRVGSTGRLSVTHGYLRPTCEIAQPASACRAIQA